MAALVTIRPDYTRREEDLLLAARDFPPEAQMQPFDVRLALQRGYSFQVDPRCVVGRIGTDPARLWRAVLVEMAGPVAVSAVSLLAALAGVVHWGFSVANVLALIWFLWRAERLRRARRVASRLPGFFDHSSGRWNVTAGWAGRGDARSNRVWRSAIAAAKVADRNDLRGLYVDGDLIRIHQLLVLANEGDLPAQVRERAVVRAEELAGKLAVEVQNAVLTRSGLDKAELPPVPDVPQLFEWHADGEQPAEAEPVVEGDLR